MEVRNTWAVTFTLPVRLHNTALRHSDPRHIQTGAIRTQTFATIFFNSQSARYVICSKAGSGKLATEVGLRVT
jgi:hypothetical protein